jgi:hypothetical protein
MRRNEPRVGCVSGRKEHVSVWVEDVCAIVEVSINI